MFLFHITSKHRKSWLDSWKISTLEGKREFNKDASNNDTSFKGKLLLLLFSLPINNYISLKCTINYTSPLLNISYKFSLKNKRENENHMHIDEKWFVLPTGKLETNVKHHN